MKNSWLIGTAAFLAFSLLLTGVLTIAAAVGSKDDPLASQSYVLDEFKPQLLSKIDDAVKKVAESYQTEMNDKFNNLSKDVDHRLNAVGGGESSSLSADDAFIQAVADAVMAKLPVSGGTDGGGGTVVTSSSGFTRVDLQKGQTAALTLGAEVMIRVGSASVVASGSPGLIDLTKTTDLGAGKTLEKNHLYICTVEGRGVKASENAIIFVNGGYSVS